ncbi:MAG: hypothetical protein ACR2GW_13510 [Pyrinomonadaceae bacterium]|nr:hypothetical protein [Acidobacteriota bacterium]
METISERVLFGDLAAEVAELRGEIADAVERVLAANAIDTTVVIPVYFNEESVVENVLDE